MAIELGDRVKDKISGLEGVVVALTNWLYGCRRVTIQPEKARDGRPVENYTIDEPQCAVVKKAVVKPDSNGEPATQARKHGDRQNIKRAADPTDR